MKIGLIRCLNKEVKCTTNQCLENIKQRSGELEAEEKLTLVGVISCGGCPGKKIGGRVERMLNEDGADRIVLAGCISADSNCSLSSSGCPHWDYIKQSLQATIGKEKIIKL